VYNIITRSGTWMSYGDLKLGQGRDKARAYMEEHPEVVAELREKIQAAYIASGQIMPKMSD
jgi:recombination protein RecA